MLLFAAFKSKIVFSAQQSSQAADNRCAKSRAAATLHSCTLIIFIRQGSKLCPNTSAHTPSSVSTGHVFVRQVMYTCRVTIIDKHKYRLYLYCLIEYIDTYMAMTKRIGAMKAKNYFASFWGVRKHLLCVIEKKLQIENDLH